MSKGISSAIGLATEAYAHRQESKQTKAAATAQDGLPPPVAAHDPSSSTLGPPPYSEDHSGSSDESSDNEDEEDWIRDETETQLAPHRADDSAGEQQSLNQIIETFTRQHPPPSYQQAVGRLPCSVIIPQRRPQNKTRGFVRAYAPVLEECGIDEATFMDFHEGFDRSINQQGWFNAVNIAVAISVVAETAALTPSVIGHVTAIVVHTSVEAGRRLYISHETNKFLDAMNTSLFRPRGLYAMIMCYQPSSSTVSETIDVNTHITSAVASRVTGNQNSFRTSSGITTLVAQMPEAAPLVFPLLRSAPEEEKKNAFKRAANFAAEYSDRRAQATFEGKNPDAAHLNVAPRKEFASRWADPNHPVNQGGLVTVLTGGAISPGARRQQKRDYRDSRRGRPSVLGRREQLAGGPGGAIGAAKRKLQEGVLYLMIINMPSEEELRAAAEITAKAKQGGFGAQLQQLMGGK